MKKEEAKACGGISAFETPLPFAEDKFSAS
jgi:hypothetical protein